MSIEINTNQKKKYMEIYQRLRTRSMKGECGLETISGEVNKKMVYQFIPWDKNYWKRSRGKPSKTFIDQHIHITGIRKFSKELGGALGDRNC